ncbi:sensor histidine kinase [Streptomyces sp. NPDC059740]|uniref:sensor histidine kinase n=1 Tax=Streptomyces sp. NPDC059740 TaxID=3346926 RepID=UPI003646A69A
MDTTRLRDPFIDAAVAIGFAVVTGIAGACYQPPGWRAFDGLGYALAALTALPLAARRRAPSLTVLVSAGVYTVYLGCGYQPTVDWWAPVAGLLSLAECRPVRVAWAVAVPVATVIALSGIAGRLPLALTAAQALLVPVVAVWFGRTRFLLARVNARLRQVTADLAAEQEARARDAVTLERIAIARELHDVVTHHMSVVTIQAGLAEAVLTSDVAAARGALRTMAEAGRGALDELRSLLTVLRVRSDEDGEETTRQAAPRLDRLPDLVDGAASAGLGIRFVVTGAPVPLPPVVEACVYRVAQEALTNVIKHAPGAGVLLTFGYTPDEVVLEVRDDGGAEPPAGRPDPAPGAGLGLIGMRERVRICGGRLSAAPCDGGGFEVRVVLPAHARRRACPEGPGGDCSDTCARCG